jgi:hypothetical protein
LGRYLAEQGIARYTELEPVLVRHFGQGEQFARNKTAALQFLRDTYQKELKRDGQVVVIESTGLSDRPIIEELARHYRFVYVKIDAVRELCTKRITDRKDGRNISNDVEAARAFYDFWQREIAPSFSFDLVVTGDHTEEAARQIKDFLK